MPAKNKDYILMPDSQDLPLIDCRSFTDYCAGHIQGATSLPAGQLFPRMHELAKKHLPITLCGDENTLKVAHAFFTERQFVIAQTLCWSDQLASQLMQQGKLETGPQSRQLWQASPLLIEFVEQILPGYQIATKNGLDLACGAGRDMVYLAMQGWNMLGMDNSAEALQRTQQLASQHQVQVNTAIMDLEKTADVLNTAGLHSQSLDLVCVFRYLHRPLLPQLASLLKPGGFIIYQTFMEGCEQIGYPKNPRFLLKANELGNTFQGFDILKNSISLLEDGRPLSAFIARKRPMADT